MSRYAIVVGRFYEDLAERLIAGAHAVLRRRPGAEAVDVFEVPGAYELPLAAKYCADSGRYAGVACLGAVIRGETTTTTTSAASRRAGSWTSSCATGVPCAFGVLTVDTMEQALARAGGGKRDSGRHAAEARAGHGRHEGAILDPEPG